MRNLGVFLLALSATITAIPSPAIACSIPPAKFEPNEFKSGVILQGIIKESRQEGRMKHVTLKVERVVQGRYEAAHYSFSFYSSKGRGACPTPGTQAVPTGKKLVVYLESRDAGLWRKAWLTVDDARSRDYRVRIPTRSNR